MSHRWITATPLLLAIGIASTIGIASAAHGQDNDAGGAHAGTTIPIETQQGVWQPAANGVQVPLWPDTVALARPDTGDRPEVTGNGSGLVGGRRWHWANNVTRPTMTIYRPTERSTGTTMLVLPGGGFNVVAMDLEGTEICDWAVRRGMTCVVLKYRSPQRWPMDARRGRPRRPEVLLALEDAQRAIGLLRQNAAVYGINPNRIGVIGFSAGAYLAANMSNSDTRTYAPIDAADRQSARPNFAIIAYTGRLWDTSNARTDLSLAPWVQISPNAPPSLLIHSMSDPTNNVRHAMAYALALGDAGVPVDLRIYSRGGHAFGMRQTDEPITTQWAGQVEQWLRDLGML